MRWPRPRRRCACPAPRIAWWSWKRRRSACPCTLATSPIVITTAADGTTCIALTVERAR